MVLLSADILSIVVRHGCRYIQIECQSCQVGIKPRKHPTERPTDGEELEQIEAARTLLDLEKTAAASNTAAPSESARSRTRTNSRRRKELIAKHIGDPKLASPGILMAPFCWRRFVRLIDPMFVTRITDSFLYINDVLFILVNLPWARIRFTAHFTPGLGTSFNNFSASRRKR